MRLIYRFPDRHAPCRGRWGDAEGGDEFVLKPRLRKLTKAGRIRSLSGQLKEGEHEYDSISFSNNWNEYRLRLQYHHGYRDAGLEAGHLKAP